LTQRQTEIAELAALGLRNGEIASQLGVGLATVRADLEALHRQLESEGPAPPAPPLRPTRDEGETT
jgi:DNA-binding NarL/FixJ family response regulator